MRSLRFRVGIALLSSLVNSLLLIATILFIATGPLKLSDRFDPIVAGSLLVSLSGLACMIDAWKTWSLHLPYWQRFGRSLPPHTPEWNDCLIVEFLAGIACLSIGAFCARL
jgi:hypothetical protein